MQDIDNNLEEIKKEKEEFEKEEELNDGNKS